MLSFFIYSLQQGWAADTPPAPANEPYASEIAAFEAADQKQMPPRDATLFIGSSSIRFWSTLAEDFPEMKVINRGFGGSQVADSTRYASRIVVPYQPARIVFYAGDNDIAGGRTPRQILGDFQGFVSKVREKLPKVRIFFISIKPSPLRWGRVAQMREANSLIADWIKQDATVTYVDVFTPMLGDDGKPRPEIFRDDKLHMNRKGYQLWTSILTPILKDDEAQK